MGPEHTVVCTIGGVYSFGSSSDGLLGRDCELQDAYDPVPRVITGLADKNVVGVAAGEDHTVVCTADGCVFTFGHGDSGQLGHGGEEDEAVPRLVLGLGTNAVGVAAGDEHTVVCTSEGQLYTFGNGLRGKLGHGVHEDEVVPRLVQGLVGKNVVGVGGGGSHTVVCTADGQLYTFGYGVGGQLGHGGQEPESVPRLVLGLVGTKVVGVAAGSTHTVVCTSEGQLYTFGHGDAGRLGHGGEEDELVPRLVEGLVGTKVVGVAAGSSHTVVCTSDGQLYTFGHGYAGRLGHGGQQVELVPRLVEGLVGKSVVGVATGNAFHSVVWTDEGEVYSFGKGAKGQLGHGDVNGIRVPKAICLDT